MKVKPNHELTFVSLRSSAPGATFIPHYVQEEWLERAEKCLCIFCHCHLEYFNQCANRACLDKVNVPILKWLQRQQ